MNYLKVSKASDLDGFDRKLYRILEILPGFLSWGTLLLLIILSYLKPVWVAYFIIAFDIYWLLLVIYLGIHLLISYKKLKEGMKINWESKCKNIKLDKILNPEIKLWEDIEHIIILPTYNEGLEVIRPTFDALVRDNYPKDKITIVFATEGRAGVEAQERAEKIRQEYAHYFKNFIITIHPDDISGELKGKGANQAWAAKELKNKIIDPQKIDYKKILISVFDIDTIIYPGYFFVLSYRFLVSPNPYRASYQPIPVYHNNIWRAPFFARVAASSNTFWQMMQQIRQEKLATYSSHSMTWQALVDIGFWSTNMVSEDSRIFWHCFLYYNGDYRVEPMYFPVSMDVCMDKNFKKTAQSLYKQQRRWGWGVENLPYLMFNTIKRWGSVSRSEAVSKIVNQMYGFHSWATNALIIGVIGWLPILLGGENFNTTVLSGNLPSVTRNLMTVAMAGMVLSAVISTMLLPKRPQGVGIKTIFIMFAQWIILPFSIIIFGSIPGLEAQTRLMFGKYMGFWVTPKSR